MWPIHWSFQNFIREVDLPIGIQLVSFDVISLLITKVPVERAFLMEEVEQKALLILSFGNDT